jgi:hypothetical protein
MINDDGKKEWKTIWKDQFDDLEIWLLDKGYNLEVAHDVEDCVILEDKLVCIQSRSRVETRYYSLLHECGHILVSNTLKQWKQDIPLYAQDTIYIDARKTRGTPFKVSLIAEEIEAWKRGRRMALKMGHYIDNTRYNKLMSDCVYSHIEDVATTP